MSAETLKLQAQHVLLLAVTVLPLLSAWQAVGAAAAGSPRAGHVGGAANKLHCHVFLNSIIVSR